MIDTRAMSFSGSSTARKEVVSAARSGSVGHNNNRRLAAGAPPSSFSYATPLSSQRSLANTLNRSSSTARAEVLRTMPHIYPALLSRVAEAFKKIIVLSESVKDGITYKDSFDGRTAVAIIAEIIKTPDRNLALLLGRALDAQKFFHDVTYDHRLRDNPNELYQFKERLAAPFIPENGVTDSPGSVHELMRAPSSGRARAIASDSGSVPTSESHGSLFSGVATPATSTTNVSFASSSPQLTMKMTSTNSVPLALDAEDPEEDLPVGVFTLLTDCYSPTCTREQLCYSINCPRRLEQMKRLNMKPQPGLSRKLSDESLHDVKVSSNVVIEC